MSTSVTIFGSALLALLAAGYVAQKYLPAPPPRIAGIDLGTTFSSIGVYHAISGEAEVIADALGRKAVPSVVAFLTNGTVLVGHAAVAQEEKNPTGTIYDAKRFIGRTFHKDDSLFKTEIKRYPFQIELDADGNALFVVPAGRGDVDSFRKLSPEHIGAVIIGRLKDMAEKSQGVTLNKAVISVPAEFDDRQRNATRKAAELAGIKDK